MTNFSELPIIPIKINLLFISISNGGCADYIKRPQGLRCISSSAWMKGTLKVWIELFLVELNWFLFYLDLDLMYNELNWTEGNWSKCK